MRIPDQTLSVVMQFTRLMNSWKAFERRGHEINGEHLTAGEIRIIKVVAEFPHKNTTEIAEELGVTKGAVSQAVTKLSERGYVRRRGVSVDERITYLDLTKKGSKTYQSHMKRYAEEVRAFDKLLTDAEPDQVAFLREFVDKLEVFFKYQLKKEA